MSSSTLMPRPHGDRDLILRVFSDPAASLSPQELVGHSIGNFLLQEVIGFGGFGVVFRAEHVHLHQPFALKLVRAHQQHDPSMLRRFQREANTLAQLFHPNIVLLKDFGQVGRFGFYFVMEYLQGIDLKSAIYREYPFSMPRVTTIIKQVCSALSYMHQKNIFHRDMKPANIILARNTGGQEQAKLIDFGIASTVTEDTSLTQTGMLLGSVPYISPEQARGDSALIDGRSDLYSLAIMAYQMLTQYLPFQAEHIPGMITHHLFTPPPLLRDRCPLQSWSPSIEDFFQKALAKAPDDRFPDAEAFSYALEQALATQVPLKVLEGGVAIPDDDSVEAVWLMPIEEGADSQEDLASQISVGEEEEREEKTELLPRQQDGEAAVISMLRDNETWDENNEMTSLLSARWVAPEHQGILGASLTFGTAETTIFKPSGTAETTIFKPSGTAETTIFKPPGEPVVLPPMQRYPEEYTVHEPEAPRWNKSLVWTIEAAVFLLCLVAGGWVAVRLLVPREPAPTTTTPGLAHQLPSLRPLGDKRSNPSLRENGSSSVGTTPQEQPWRWHIRTTPPGAAVFLEGVRRGVTPMVLVGAPYTTFQVLLKAPGHEPLTALQTLNAPETQQTLQLRPVSRDTSPAPRRKSSPSVIRVRKGATGPRRRSFGGRTRPRPRPRPRPAARKNVYGVADPF